MLYYYMQRTDSVMHSKVSDKNIEILKAVDMIIDYYREKNIDKKYLEFKCPKCQGNAKKVSKWKYSNRWFMANFICDCGEKFNGRVTFKKTYDDLIVRQKICEFKEKKQKEKTEVTV